MRRHLQKKLMRLLCLIARQQLQSYYLLLNYCFRQQHMLPMPMRCLWIRLR